MLQSRIWRNAGHVKHQGKRATKTRLGKRKGEEELKRLTCFRWRTQQPRALQARSHFASTHQILSLELIFQWCSIFTEVCFTLRK